MTSGRPATDERATGGDPRVVAPIRTRLRVPETRPWATPADRPGGIVRTMSTQDAFPGGDHNPDDATASGDSGASGGTNGADDTPGAADAPPPPPPFAGFDPGAALATPGSVTGELMYAPDERIDNEGAMCVQCSYAIVGLLAGGNCPECGTPLERSLRGKWLRYSSPEYVGRLQRGILIVLITLATQFVLALLLGGAGFLGAIGLAATPGALNPPAQTFPAAPGTNAPANGTAATGIGTPTGQTPSTGGITGGPFGDSVGGPAGVSPGTPPGAVAGTAPATAPGTAANSTAALPPTAPGPWGGAGAGAPNNPAVFIPTAIQTLMVINYLLAVVAASVGAWGWWLITTPDPGLPTHDNGGVPRRLIRIAVVGFVAAKLLDFGSVSPGLLFGPGGFSALMIAGVILGIFVFVATIGQIIASMLYMAWLATRFPDEVLHRRARMYAWLLPLIWFVGLCACGLGPLVQGIMAWLLMLRAHQGLRAIQAVHVADANEANEANETMEANGADPSLAISLDIDREPHP